METIIHSRTRANMAEFERAARAAKLVRDAIWPLMNDKADRKLDGRLTREMINVIRTDKLSGHGYRNVLDGDIKLLTGFAFNNTGLNFVLERKISTKINRASGELSLTIPSFIPKDFIQSPPGRSHFRLYFVTVAIDFHNNSFESAKACSPEFLLSEETEQITLLNSITPNSPHPLFLFIGIGKGLSILEINI